MRAELAVTTDRHTSGCAGLCVIAILEAGVYTKTCYIRLRATFKRFAKQCATRNAVGRVVDQVNDVNHVIGLPSPTSQQNRSPMKAK